VHIRNRMLALLGVAAAAVMAVPGAAQAAPAPVAPNAVPVVHIQSQGNGLCLQPTSAAADVAVVQEPCNPTLNLQDWTFQRVGSDPTYVFVNLASGTECLWAFGNGDAGAPVGVEPCRDNPASNERFNAGLTLPDSVFLESLAGFRHTGQCLTVPPGAVIGSQMQIRPCRPANVSVEGWNIF
jgi:ricin-type beta-trefoil lectin protein